MHFRQGFLADVKPIPSSYPLNCPLKFPLLSFSPSPTYRLVQQFAEAVIAGDRDGLYGLLDEGSYSLQDDKYMRIEGSRSAFIEWMLAKEEEILKNKNRFKEDNWDLDSVSF